MKYHGKFLEDMPYDRHLKLKNGKKIKNLHELSIALEHMDDSLFKKHVTKKNDFRNWVYSVVKDLHLAHDMAHAKTRDCMASVVHNRIVDLQRVKYKNAFLYHNHLHIGLKEFAIGLFFGLLLGSMMAVAML